MENKDILVWHKTAPPGDKGGFWGKNVEKKNENLTCRGDFGKKKQKIENFTCRSFNRPFSKTTFFHQYIRGVT